MTDTALFIGWGVTHPGREHQALKLFEEAVEIFEAQVKIGEIESFETVLLGPHGGELEGFFVIRGELAKLTALLEREEIERMRIKAQAIKTHFGIVPATVGEAAIRSYQLYVRVVDELTQEPAVV